MAGVRADFDADAALLDAWSAVLDDFEAALDRAVAHAATMSASGHVTEAPSAFTPPTSMPPMPVELADRVRALVERNAEVTAEVSELVARLRPTAPAPTGRRSHYVQRSAASTSFDARG